MRRFLPVILFRRALLPLLAVLLTLSHSALAQDAMEGTVVSQSGVPVAGATVYLANSQFTYKPVWGSVPAVTDARGHFLVETFPGFDMLNGTLAVVPPASAPISTAAVTFLGVKTNGPHRVTLAPATRLTVKFTDQNGIPLANRRVLFWHEYEFRRDRLYLPKDRVSALTSRFPILPPSLETKVTARTDTRGVLTIARAAQNARYSVIIDAARGRLPPPMLSQSLVTGSRSVSDLPTIRLTLNEKRYGIVTHRTTGKPLAGARVKLYPPRTGVFRTPLTTVTDQNGRYRFSGLYPGDFSVYAQAPPGYLIASGGGRTALRPGETNFFAVRATNIVVHVRNADGVPVFGQEIAIEKKDGKRWTAVEVDRESASFPDWSEPIDIMYSDWTVRTDIRGLARFTVQLPEACLRLKREPETNPAPDDTRIVTLHEGETWHVYFGSAPPKVAALHPFAVAPDFTALDSGGKTVHLSDFRGKVVVLDIMPMPKFFPGDPESEIARQMAPLLASCRRAAAFKGKQIVFLTVLLGDNQVDYPSSFPQVIERLGKNTNGVRFLRAPSESYSRLLDSRLTGYNGLGKERVQRHIIGPDGTFRDSPDFTPSNR